MADKEWGSTIVNMKLENKKCLPCEKGTLALQREELKGYLNEVTNWKHIGRHIEKDFKFKDFKQALKFTNKVGELAEKERHHPDIYLAWGKVKIILWTHAIKGLSENDFILAKKIDLL